MGSLLNKSIFADNLTGRAEDSNLEGLGDKSLFQIDDDNLGAFAMSISGEESKVGRLPGEEGIFLVIFNLFLAEIIRILTKLK